MIVCRQCGHHNDDSDTFCGSCGRFLEWTGERITPEQPAPEPAAEPEPQPEAEPARPTLIERVKQAVRSELEAQPAGSVMDPVRRPDPAPVAEPPPTAPAPLPIGGALTSAPVTTAATASTPPGPAAAAPAKAAAPEVEMRPPPAVLPPERPIRTPVSAPPSVTSAPGIAMTTAAAAPPMATPSQAAPVSPPSRQPEEPLSRRPTAPQAPPRPRQAPRIEAPTRRQPGDKICGECGEGNDPIRHFCKRCGNSLDEALIVRVPWWRRLLNVLFPRRSREAGWRPDRVGGVHPFRTLWRVLRLALAAVVLVFVALFALVPSFQASVRHFVNTEYTKIRLAVHPNYDAITLVAAQASSQTPGHLASMTIDNITNTYWAAQPRDAHPVLHITFAQPTEVARMLVTSGPAGTAPTDQFKAQPRPEEIRLIFSSGQVATFTLKDQAAPQVINLSVPQATGVEIDVVSEFPALAGSPVLSSVAINEIEFRVKD